MIKKLIDKLLGKAEGGAKATKIPLGKRTEIPATEHGIDPELLDDRAIKVVRTLQDADVIFGQVGAFVAEPVVTARTGRAGRVLHAALPMLLEAWRAPLDW